MLRVHFLQQWFNLSDPRAEDSLYDGESMRRFAQVELDDEVGKGKGVGGIDGKDGIGGRDMASRRETGPAGDAETPSARTGLKPCRGRPFGLYRALESASIMEFPASANSGPIERGSRYG